ncbi:ATP-binding protein [Sphaerisporangium corydalis]|uniref:ATP-binding protein n=1 Tax=Sphaerisporangium corydalis TaxID=1441875 RepID=A0ABV9E7X7_9ACTN|nr:ATP-binding protein [Sphaerisporangium corydalis]
MQDLVDDVVLVVGELLANAIVYGDPPIGLALSAEAHVLEARVTDLGPEVPRRLDLGVEGLHGRGLTIIEALSHECGVLQGTRAPGKAVWARWHLPT